MEVHLITKDDCPFCDKSKSLLNSRGIEFTQSKIGNDITREEVMETYPNARSVPIITIDGVFLGGYDALVKKLDGEDNDNE